MDENTRPVKLLVSIVNRGKGEKVEELLQSMEITYHLICLGHGTADSDILDYLGLGETDKDIVLSVIENDKIPLALDTLDNKLHFSKDGNGIAFTIPINSVGGPITLKVLTGLLRREH
ncbi:hypothetical protein EDD66_10615 [Mobilisporobacter senegalensis]|uniref:Uncharacterized protein n=1 Tax=Mobilisporobacter senegalensis TaxID=1329262 RepID=A0A3N1XKT0_9FIRM|nr:hypothetical protein [Mobilisporobacter senegalensis]ROR27320.1 hypothetical protein EDD66_10615 [Mobilisporobacter senegalensis]